MLNKINLVDKRWWIVVESVQTLQQISGFTFGLNMLNHLMLAIVGGATNRGLDFIYSLTILLFFEYLRSP